MGITDVLKNHRYVMCDTAPIIYFIEEHDTYGAIADKVLSLAKESPEHHIFSSVITLIEVLAQPLRKARMDIVDKYRDFLLNSNNFSLYPIDAVIAEKAASLRAQYGIKTPDAIQFAVGIENNATLFITNDTKLKAVKDINVLVLKDFVS